MIHPKKQEQIDKIREYIVKHSMLYDKLVIFGDAACGGLSEEGIDDIFLDVAVKTIREEDATDSDVLFDLYAAIDDATEGRFHLIIMNDPDVTTNVRSSIDKGVVVYDGGVEECNQEKGENIYESF